MTADDWIAKRRVHLNSAAVDVHERTQQARALDALETVLELHYRRVWSVLNGDHMHFAQTEFPDQCDHCRRAYPCETVAAITEALGVTP